MSQSPVFARLHPGVQRAIWSLGWETLKPIQSAAIHALLAEDAPHLLLCAQTAAGKTEAAFLPIISRLAEAPAPSVQALYVAPPKALINDQFRRLEMLCEHLEVHVHRWHGNVPASKKKALRERPGGILLVTPESLESNFLHFAQHVPRVYRDLSYVVIDELHSFLHNVRGVHLRSLPSRLTAATGRTPRLLGPSATLAARAFIAPDTPESVHVIEDPGARREMRFGIRTSLRRPLDTKGNLLPHCLSPQAACQTPPRAGASGAPGASRVVPGRCSPG